jgi:hypothetical protein
MLIAVLISLAATGCSSAHTDAPPPTITPAGPAVSPPVSGTPDGAVRPLPGPGIAAIFDAATASLVVLGTDARGHHVVSIGSAAPVPLPGGATALIGDGQGTAYLATRGGYFRLDIARRAATLVGVDGQSDTDFTAITRRADGTLVLGTADGAVLRVSGSTVQSRLKAFARVDQLVAQDNDVVVLDRGQTSVTEINAAGTSAAEALRAGDGATTMAVDPAGRVLVADTRGDGLLVFGTSPLLLRQRAPVRGAPYGVVGSPTLTWVSETATNSVVGYDLSTGIPVEKVRYRTVQQPNTLAYDEHTGTLFVVSASGAGVQEIPGAGR